MLKWLQAWLQTDDTKLIYILTLILIANIIDFILGIFIAQFSDKVNFSSSKAKLGILMKIIIFIMLVVFIPIALLVPYDIGIGALYVLYTGILYSELRSIFAHINLASDEKTSNLLEKFVEVVFQKGKDDKK